MINVLVGLSHAVQPGAMLGVLGYHNGRLIAGIAANPKAPPSPLSARNTGWAEGSHFVAFYATTQGDSGQLIPAKKAGGKAA